MTTVTTAEFVRAFGRFHDEARQSPVVITKHGRLSTVLVSIEMFEELQRLQQREAAKPTPTKNSKPRERSSKKARSLHHYIAPGAYVWLSGSKLAFVIEVAGENCTAWVRSKSGGWSDTPVKVSASSTDNIAFPPTDDVERFRLELQSQGRLSASSKLGKRTAQLPDGRTVSQPIEIVDGAEPSM